MPVALRWLMVNWGTHWIARLGRIEEPELIGSDALSFKAEIGVMLRQLAALFALLGGMVFLMLGGGLQGILIPVRGQIEGFSFSTARKRKNVKHIFYSCKIRLSLIFFARVSRLRKSNCIWAQPFCLASSGVSSLSAVLSFFLYPRIHPFVFLLLFCHFTAELLLMMTVMQLRTRKSSKISAKRKQVVCHLNIDGNVNKNIEFALEQHMLCARSKYYMRNKRIQDI